MEQIQELFEILKSTPEMALWGLTIWCLYILLKLASIVFAIKVVFQLAINKWHDYKIKKLGIDLSKKENELKDKEVAAYEELVKADKLVLEATKKEFNLKKQRGQFDRLLKRFNEVKVSDLDIDHLIVLIDAVKSTQYLHRSDIEKALKKLKEKS